MQEISGKKLPLPQDGLYRHKESGKEVKLTGNPGIGTPMIDSFVQSGYELVEETEVEEVEEVVAPKKAKKAKKVEEDKE